MNVFRTSTLSCSFGAIAVAFMAALAGCSSGVGTGMTSFSAKGTQSETPQLFTIPADQMSHVQIVTVQPGKLTRTLRLTGTVAFNAFETTPVITQVGGPVSRVFAVPGQYVRAGQPLLEVSSPDYSQLLATYLKASDTLRVATENYKRAQDLYAHHAIAQRDLLQAESDQVQAQADTSAATQAMKTLGIKDPEGVAKRPSAFSEIPLLAPIAGEVVERLVSPGQVLQAGSTQAFTISNTQTVWVLANVYQSDLAYIRRGNTVSVATDAYPTTFHGRISYISPALDPNTRTLQARIVVDNPGDKLKKDMYVTVSVMAGVIPKAIAVPDAAILRNDENEPFVYIETAPGTFGRRQVRIGQNEAGKTEILSGIAPGEKVVANGSLFLQFANTLQ
ncbi:MAG TPA: efflux RND transporter periplasmic adaptor subunit [Candidatus Dormibacteraeota bacterium]|nr:efflux RND transporter periplasmic adaptor subunit [Candidatus Dormibacteraeota bacterium]